MRAAAPLSADAPVLYHLRFASAFLASISRIIVSEFGDKTFFIAAIMAMRNNRLEGQEERDGRGEEGV